MPLNEDVNPQDDPEFWDRPADPPPYRQQGDYASQRVIFVQEHLLFRGDTALNKKTGTIYQYTITRGWVRDDQPG